MEEKIQKILARAGLGSRRQIEQWIKDGRVTVNQKLVKIGDRAEAFSEICVDGQPIKKESFKPFEKMRVLIYHKPIGEICTRFDPQDRRTPFDNLPPLEYGRWIMIGRLDINTSGLLLFTTSGELAHALMHPSSQMDRVYMVRVLGTVEPDILKRLKKGMTLEGEHMHFHDIQYVSGEGANHWYRAVLKEGRHREVRRLLESQGVKVSRLIRIQFANVSLPRDLKTRNFRELKKAEIEFLKKVCGKSV